MTNTTSSTTMASNARIIEALRTADERTPTRDATYACGTAYGVLRCV
jgi:hypothetical protein